VSELSAPTPDGAQTPNDDTLTPHPNGTKALALMRELGIRASPLNFTLWYEYVCARDPALVTAIDELRAQGRAFDEETSRDLHARFLASPTSEAPGAIQKLRRSIEDLGEYVRQSHEESATREANIAWIGDEMESGNEADLSKLIARLRDELSEIAESRTAVSERIRDASDQIKTLVGVVGSEVQTFIGRNTAYAAEFAESLNAIKVMERRLTRSQIESKTDALTGIANRKHFDEALRAAINHAATTKEPLCLVLVDIDFFKKFNDTHGHLIGDQVLRLVARELSEHTKERDTVARYGGEEFVFILPNATGDQAASVVERLRTSIQLRSLVIRATREKLGQITLSFGLTEYQPGDTPINLISRADKALFQAKRNGRNRLERI
jgi:diguanylate cyclase